MARPWAPEIPEADFKEAIRRPGHVKELLQLRLDQRNRTNRPTRPFVGYMNEAELLITQSKPHTLNALTIASARIGPHRTIRMPLRFLTKPFPRCNRVGRIVRVSAFLKNAGWPKVSSHSNMLLDTRCTDDRFQPMQRFADNDTCLPRVTAALLESEAPTSDNFFRSLSDHVYPCDGQVCCWRRVRKGRRVQRPGRIGKSGSCITLTETASSFDLTPL